MNGTMVTMIDAKCERFKDYALTFDKRVRVEYVPSERRYYITSENGEALPEWCSLGNETIRDALGAIAAYCA